MNMEKVILFIVVNLAAVCFFCWLINSLLRTTASIKAIIRNKQNSLEGNFVNDEFLVYNKKDNEFVAS